MVYQLAENVFIEDGKTYTAIMSQFEHEPIDYVALSSDTDALIADFEYYKNKQKDYYIFKNTFLRIFLNSKEHKVTLIQLWAA
jgi:hypothetical protein